MLNLVRDRCAIVNNESKSYKVRKNTIQRERERESERAEEKENVISLSFQPQSCKQDK